MSVTGLKKELRLNADPKRAEAAKWYFKTGPGEYGEGDHFIGISVPNLRKIAKAHQALSLAEIEALLSSKTHEERLLAVLILVLQYRRADDYHQEEIYNFYLAHTDFINNWDIVDSSAEYIVGPFLEERDKDVLVALARSSSLWERRIAIIATFHYIREGNPEWSLKLAELLLNDEHDLIQKAVGWMLREIGKRCGQKILEDFLLEGGRYKSMPRTTLRYAIERLPEKKRQAYLKGKI